MSYRFLSQSHTLISPLCVSKKNTENNLLITNFNSDDNSIYELDETGSIIWKYIDESLTTSELQEKLKDEFGALTAENLTDIEEFLNFLYSNKLIECTPPPQAI